MFEVLSVKKNVDKFQTFIDMYLEKIDFHSMKMLKLEN